MQSRRSHLNHPNGGSNDATAGSSNEEFGTKRTMIVLVIIVGCFAVVWPKIFYPMLVGNSTPQPKQNAGCCDVISELDVDTIKIMSELCGTIIEHDEGTVLSPKAIVSQCKKAVIDKCGIDLSAALYDRVSLGHSTKQILEEVRSLNGSLCLKYYFGVAPWKLGVPHRVNLHLDTANTIKQERPSIVNPVKLHPALKERGRTIYGADQVTTEARRKRPPPIIVEGRPGPIPGRRPTMGLPGEIAPSKISNYGLMGVLMPIYTIAFIIFFTYIVKQIVYKKKPVNYVGSPLYPPCDSDEQFEQQVFQAHPQYFNRPNRDTSKIGDIELDQLRKRLRETELAMERIVSQMAQVPLATQDIKVNGDLPKDEEQSSVTVMGMETRASCENGGKWSRPDSPVLRSPEPPAPIEPTSSLPQIFLEGSLPPQSQILVADSATEAQPDADDNSSVILAGKMTLSVISLDSEPGNEEPLNIAPKNESSDEEGRISSSNTSEEFEKIYACDVEDHINNIIEEAENAVLAEKSRDSHDAIPVNTTALSDILEEMRKEFNLVEDLLQSSTGTEGQTTEDFLARDERFNNTGNSMEPTETTVQEPQGINSDPKPVYNAHDLLAEIEGTLQKARSDENPNDDLEEVNKTVRSNEEENDLNDTKRGYLMYSEDFLRDEEDKMEASDLKNTIETATAYKIPQHDSAEDHEEPDELTEFVVKSEQDVEQIVKSSEN